MLEGYDKKLGALKTTDLRIRVVIEENDMIIEHSSEEFGTNGHMHVSGLAEGMKQLVEYYLEHLIWKYEEANVAEHASVKGDHEAD